MGDPIHTATLVLLVLAIGLALAFEFVNGFHDTANAVATVIYTHTLKPTPAVIWSGCWNLIGVLLSSGAVAFGITSLLPVELVLNVGSAAGFAMVFSLLISAILWNLGTWYLGLPASSSHTLVGSILGVGLANAMVSGGRSFGDGVNWAKAQEVGISLLISPLVGFSAAAALLLLCRALIKRRELYVPADPHKAPPLWIRAILMLTCTGVSFAHGSNDGQKGMGLIMLILVGILPGAYALNMSTAADDIAAIVKSGREIQIALSAGSEVSEKDAQAELSAFLKASGSMTSRTIPSIAAANARILAGLDGKQRFSELPVAERRQLRTDFYLVAEALGKLAKTGQLPPALANSAPAYRTKLDRSTRFIPSWVKIAVAFALGIGTMIGWKRIVVTVGEKIGKEHLSYAQGAAAEVVAMTTIGVADMYGLPVSTTHVLSSGVAGTMAANHSGLQTQTLKSLLMAWVLTLPACVFLGAVLFSLGLNVVFLFGLK